MKMKIGFYVKFDLTNPYVTRLFDNKNKSNKKKMNRNPSVSIDSKMLVAHDEAKHNSHEARSLARYLARSFWLRKHDTIK